MSELSSWEALPQRARRRRSGGGISVTPDVVGVSASTASAAPHGPSSGRSQQREEHRDDSQDVKSGEDGDYDGRGIDKESPLPPLPPPRTTDEEGQRAPPLGDEGGSEGAGSGEGEATRRRAARHAAVATAVEERAKMERFEGGLDGGAGADGTNFEYLDHTADVQIHSWGDSMERAMEGALAALFNIITDIEKVEVERSLTRDMKITGHDAMSLLFALLDEFLFLFHAEGLAVRKATIVGAIDRTSWTLTATAEGETFDLTKHPQGTEVKAITYSNMQINENPETGRTDIYVIVDI